MRISKPLNSPGINFMNVRIGGLLLILCLLHFFRPQTSVAQAPPFAGCDVLTQIPEEECIALEIFLMKWMGNFGK